MDLAPIVLTALGIVFVLQIVTIVKIIRISALLEKPEESKSEVVAQPSIKKDFNPRDSRRGNRPPRARENQHKGQAPVSTVDNSLRDINLRLKNAERDQEQARKNLGGNNKPQGQNRKPSSTNPSRDNASRDQGDKPFRNNAGRGQSDKPYRENSGRDRGDKSFKRRNQERPRNPQRSGQPYGENQRDQSGPANASSAPADEVSLESMVTVIPPVQPVIEPFLQPAPAAVLPVSPEKPAEEPSSNQEATDSVQEDAFGRGNKITVKRRSLNGGSEKDEGVTQETPAASSEPVLPKNEGDEISFGRR